MFSRIFYWRVVINSLIEVAIAMFCVLLLFSFLDLNLVFIETHVAGGDMVAHPWLAHSFYQAIKSGHLYHWNHGWFAGFPYLYYYFYPIYALTSFLTAIGFSEAVSFKLMVLIVVASVPLTSYIGSRLILKRGTSFFITLLMITIFLDETHSFWGGNFKSVLAGQVSHQLGLSFLFLFFCLTLSKYNSSRAMIISLSLSVMSHIYSALYATILSVIALIDQIRKNLKSLSKIYLFIGAGLVAAGLAAFWWAPFISYRSFTATPLNNVDVSWAEAIRVLRWDDKFIRILYLLTLVSLFPALKFATTRVHALLLLLTCVASIVALPYLKGTPFLHIRLIPQITLFCVFIILLGIKSLEREKNQMPLQVGLALLGLLIFSGRLATTTTSYWPSALTYPAAEISGWWNWNMMGLERKPAYADAAEVFKKLKDHPDLDGRVVVEYSNYNRMGSPRIFEMTPFFSGRSVMEGLTIESSNSNAFYFYSMFLFQPTTWWPGFPIQVPPPDPARGLQMLSRYHVKFFVASSDETKKALRDLKIPETFSNSTFSLFEVNADSHLVSRLDGSLPHARTRRPFYESILALPTSLEKFIVLDTSKESSDDLSAVTLSEVTLKVPQVLTGIESRWSDDGQVLHVAATQASSENPVRLLFKVPYFPNWKTSTGEKVELVTPNLMVVETKSPNLDLAFTLGLPERFGLFFSGLSLLIFVFWGKTRKVLDKG